MPDARLQRTRENYRKENPRCLYEIHVNWLTTDTRDWVAEQLRLVEQIHQHGVDEPGYGAGV